MEIGLQIYVKGSVEAVALYQEAFDAELGYSFQNDDGTYMHAELSVDGNNLLAVSEFSAALGYQFLEKYSPERYPTMQYSVTLKEKEAVNKAFDVLSVNGIVLHPVGKFPWSDCCAGVVDRFGVSWYITVPGHRPDDDELGIE